ncbi:MAG: OmpH family outer membrane protein [Ferruginibacter sp.]|nr:OmpH family outer membrane protein [Ferruginibacter sp.]
MRKLIILAIVSFSTYIASAQNKTGYINTEELIAAMPEAEKAEAELKEYQTSLAQQGQDMMKELNDKDSIFVKDSLKLSPSMKEIKKNELVSLYQRVQSWNQQAQEMYQQEAQKKIIPIRNKAFEAIRAVAKESGYAYILDSNSVIVGPPGDDVLALVKKKLGIKSTATQPKRP